MYINKTKMRCLGRSRRDSSEDAHISDEDSNKVSNNKFQQKYYVIKDLTQLDEITLENVLNCLAGRFYSHQYYTFAGSVLVSLNPCLKESLSQQYMSMSKYKAYLEENTIKLKELEPHVYSIGLKSLSNLRTVGNNQVIIISGDSGAGKTTCTQQLIKFCTEVNLNLGNYKSTVGDLEKKIYFATLILESFGNACTSSNPNSSRFGRLVQLSYNSYSSIEKAEIKTYLLEKHRVVRVDKGTSNERNFHIFYYLLQGLKRGSINIADISRGCRNDYKVSLKCLKDKIQDTDIYDFEPLSEALKIFSLTDYFMDVFRIIFAIVHLNSVKFTARDDQDDNINNTAQYVVANEQYHHIKSACKILGLKKSALVIALLFQKISVGNRQSIVYTPCKQQSECEERLQAFITSLYDKLFNHILFKLNASLRMKKETTTEQIPELSSSIENEFSLSNDQKSTSEAVATTLSILDLYGFENLEVNSLEQICINYANELLQKVQISVLKNYFEQDKLLNEARMGFTKPSELNRVEMEIDLRIEELHLHIFSILDQGCILKRQNWTDKNVFEELKPKCSKSNPKKCNFINIPERSKNPERLYQKDYSFIIRHYATDVTYQMNGMIEKNKDAIPREFGNLLNSSTNHFVRSLFQQSQSSCPTPSRNNINEGGKTVLARFKSSVNELIKELRDSEDNDLHFIRCIRPNTDLVEGKIESCVVKNQLYACGIVDIIRIAGNGYPIRIQNAKFKNDFPKILRYFCGRKLNINILSLVFSFQKCPIKFGNSAIFMNENTWKFLKNTENFVSKSSAVKLQRSWRNFVLDKVMKITPRQGDTGLENENANNDNTVWFTPSMTFADFSVVPTPGPFGDGFNSRRSSSDYNESDMDISTDELEQVVVPSTDGTKNEVSVDKHHVPLYRLTTFGSGIVSKFPVHTLPIKFYTKKTAIGFSFKPPQRLVANGLQDAFEEYGIIHSSQID